MGTIAYNDFRSRNSESQERLDILFSCHPPGKEQDWMRKIEAIAPAFMKYRRVGAAAPVANIDEPAACELASDGRCRHHHAEAWGMKVPQERPYQARDARKRQPRGEIF